MAKAFSILLFSSTKYFFGIVLAITSIEESKFLPNYIFNILGGLIGIAFFIYFGAWIKKLLLKYFPISGSKTFSWRNRFLVKLRNRVGVPGIAFLTPIFLSIPLGVFVSLSITDNKRKILGWTMAACIFWSTAFFLAYKLLGIELPFSV